MLMMIFTAKSDSILNFFLLISTPTISAVIDQI